MAATEWPLIGPEVIEEECDKMAAAVEKLRGLAGEMRDEEIPLIKVPPRMFHDLNRDLRIAFNATEKPILDAQDPARKRRVKP